MVRVKDKNKSKRMTSRLMIEEAKKEEARGLCLA